jgi:hypothetical protein
MNPTPADPIRELAELNAQIADLRARLDPLTARRRELLSIIDGPRVIPVLVYWQHNVRHEHPCSSVDEGFALSNAMLDDGTGWGEHVLVGGAVVTEDEWRGWRRG